MLDLIGRFPADLDALGARGRARPDARRRPRDRRARTSACSRPGCERRGARATRPADRRLPADRSAPSPAGGSRARAGSMRRATPALWCWDHFMGRGDLTVPVVESLDDPVDGGGADDRRSTVAPFVLNVMNRHPALVARMASTLQIASGGRLILGIGIGGAPKEHAAYGMDFPDAPERVARLEEAVAVIRALWTGGPVTRAVAVLPARGRRRRSRSRIPPPPIIIGGETPAGARLAGPHRRRLEHVRRQLRGEPAALPRDARGGRSSARGPARPRRVPGRLARATRSSAAPTGSTTRAGRGSAGTRSAPTGRSSSRARPPMSMRSWMPSPAGSGASWHHRSR